ncbi:MAG: hypothetical protein K2H62_03290 [Bacteroidales bacterium]|nr:hypothetical protein [Bacteroidales bacterium]
MMKSIKIFQTVLFVLALGCCTTVSAANKQKKADKDTDNWRYEIECAGTGADGTYLVKVWSYSKKADLAAEQSLKNAVHGVLFKGITGQPGGCPSQRALISTPNVQNEQRDFFAKFFSSNGGDFRKYAVATGTPERVKLKKEYKVGVTVSVAKDQLRRDLESAGIIKGLGSGF